LNNIVVLGLGGYFVMQHQMSVGTLIAFQSLLSSFSEPFNQLVSVGGELQQLHGDMNRIDDVIHYSNSEKPRIIDDKSVMPIEKNAEKLTGRLEIKNITFGYSRLEPALIEDFSLSISPGEMVAIVGPSCSGRSTLLNLTMDLYQPWSGEILFDHQKKLTLSKEQWVKSVGFVSQQIRLFSGTIRENLSLWNKDIPLDDIVLAAKDAEIYKVIALRREGFDSLVNGNARNFSGGEAQRLEIARALVQNPTLLILDEATSALDPPLEAQLIENLKRRGCTCLMVAHRLSTVRHCDKIIVIDKGKMVQFGTHQQLIKEQTGLYYQLTHAH
jgi:ABC-type bacteriocin/lantibiotic exporter with double-glycine peptidase domain